MLPVLALLLTLPQIGAAQAKKYALLVGVNKYEHTEMNQPSPLAYAEADVVEMAELLRASGYEVDLLVGPKATREAVAAAIKGLAKKGNAEGVVLVGLAGHGVQLEKDDDAYYCPFDTGVRLAERDGKPVLDRNGKQIIEPDPATLVKLTDIVGQFRLSPGGSRLLLADCCRNDPTTGRGRGVGSGIKTDLLPGNTAVLFSCSQGQRAFEDKKWGHGAFFYYVLQGLREGKGTALSLSTYLEENVAKDVKNTIRDAPEQEPHPLINGRRLDFLIKLSDPAKVEITNPRIVKARDAKLNKEFEYLQYDLGKGVELKLVKISAKGKTFVIGSPKGEKDRFDHEEQREITLTDDYYIGQFEITRGQFRRYIEETGDKTEAEEGDGGYGWNEDKKEFEGRDKKYSWKNLGFTQTDEHPVANVSWNDAKKFCAWLAKKSDGKLRLGEVRLPGEAEWEFTCRAGSKSRFSFGDDEEGLAEYGNVADADFRAKTKRDWGIKASDGYVFTAPVGKFKPNDFGVYDMHGNVWEWCEDYYGKYADLPKKQNQMQIVKQSNDVRVLRGGSWSDYPRSCRSAYRFVNSPGARNGKFGFRVVVSQD